MSLTLTLSLALPTAPLPRLVGEYAEMKTATGTLHGTIDLPARPVVILHAGSGPTDRDGNGPLVRTDNLKILGRTLAGGGVAVPRIDKRGIGASAQALAKEEDVRLETYAADAAAWAAQLRQDPRFTKVG